MAHAQVPGLALALIRHGTVVYTKAYGWADRDQGRPLRTDTVMYGASLTKAAFAYLVMQLVDEGVVDLDTPVTRQLSKPLPSYPEYSDLAADPRWQLLTPRMLLSHSSGLLNWRWINDDRKLDLKYAPGERYVYSGEGIQILQLIVEERTCESLDSLMQTRVFDRFGMRDTSMVWKEAFAGRQSNRYDLRGQPVGHQQRKRPRGAGSMDTTLEDYARFMAGVLRGDGLTAASKNQMLGPQIRIVSPQQFPSHFPGQTQVNDPIALSAGLGWVVYESPSGPAFFKEGNDEGTNNFALGFRRSGDGILLLSNSSNGDKIFYPLVQRVFGRTCLPWFWMGYIPYDKPEWRATGVRDRPPTPCESTQ